MHLCLQQQVPWAIGDGRTKGCLKYPLTAAYERGVFGARKSVLAIHSSGMVCQGPSGDAIQSGGAFEDGFMRCWGGSWCCIAMAQVAQPAGTTRLEPRGQCGNLSCSNSGCSYIPVLQQDMGWHNLKALFKGTSVILIILSARTTGQHSAVLGSFSDQNFSPLLMLAFS